MIKEGENMSNALMLTGTINPAAYNNTNVVLTDAEERLKQYERAIAYYIKETKFEKIIFVENSGSEFDHEKYEQMAEKLQKKFEYVPICTDKNATIKYGKSYGEADCIEQGVYKSRLLKDEECFYKMTGRVILKNANHLCKENEMGTALLFRTDLGRCYTFFFRMNIEDFHKYFYKAKKLCNEAKGVDIERAYYRIAAESGKQISTFYQFPKLEGTIGTDGKSYGDSWIVYFGKNMLTKIGMYSQSGNSGIMNLSAKIKLFLFRKK